MLLRKKQDPEDLIRELMDDNVLGGYRERVGKHGRELTARCPFHKEGKEAHPSFNFNVEWAVFNCYSCGVRGGLPQFLELLGNDKNTVHKILNDVDWKPRPRSHEEKAPWRGKNKLKSDWTIPEHVLGLFNASPMALVNDGYPDAMLRKFEIGYDRLNERITFPIRDVFGRLIAISGRDDVPGGYGPKYNFYTEELENIVGHGYAPDKHMTFWNAHRVITPLLAFDSLPQTPPYFVIVEGFKAGLRLIQYGYHNTIALMGASMSDEQRLLLTMAGVPVILFLDNNFPGRLGTSRIYKSLLHSCVPRVHIARYPREDEWLQPDDLTSEEARASIEQSLQQIIPTLP